MIEISVGNLTNDTNSGLGKTEKQNEVRKKSEVMAFPKVTCDI